MTARVYSSAPNTTNNNLLERHTSTNNSVLSTSENFEGRSAPLPAATALVAAATVPTPDMSFYGSGLDDSDNSEAILARRRNVSRNLFGVPSAATAEYARNKLREMLQKESARWNFDFEAEKPLPGRFQWEPVAGGRNTLASLEVAASAPKINQTVVVQAQVSEEPPSSQSGPTQPKLRRVDLTESRSSSHRDPLPGVVTSTSVGTIDVSLNSANIRRKYPSTVTTAPTTTTTSTTTYGTSIPTNKPLFPPKTGNSSAGESTPPPSPPQLNSMIPATVLVTATAVDPLDDAARKYLSTDSGRRKEKQMKITMYSAVKKRRIGHGTAAAEKKAF